MNRIDVLPAEKGRFKVLVNFIQRGVAYQNARQANKEAKKVLDKTPNGMISYALEN